MNSAMLMILMLQVDMQIDSPYMEHCQQIAEYEYVCRREFIADEYEEWLNSD